METTFIYALNDPETGECRYVGKSDNPKERFSDHFTECRDKTHRRANWLRSLTALGLKPTLEVIDEVPFEHWKQLEVAYIEFFLERGCDLVNSTPGGEDPPRSPMLGKTQSLETRVKIGAANRGKKRSAETCAKIGAGQLGKKLSLEHRAKLSAALRGKTRSPEHQAKLNAAQLGRKRSPETCAKMSAAMLIKMRSPEARLEMGTKMRGKKHSPETRDKMKRSQSERRAKEKRSFPNE